MNRIQANLAGIGLLLVAAVAVAWPRLKQSETSPPRDDARTASVKTRATGIRGALSSPAQDGLLPTLAPASVHPGSSAHGESRIARQSTNKLTHLSSAGAPNPGVNHTPASGPASANLQETADSVANRLVDLRPSITPAVFIEIDHPAVSSPDAGERLGEIAGEFADAISQSGLDPATPGYRQLWDREQVIADTRFRSMYGGHAWMAHHIQSHHAMSEVRNQ
jgi:hypothetical protein